MGKLIDSDTTKKALKECGLWNADYEAEISCDIIDDQPAVDAVPIVHAHWDCIENVFSYEGVFDAYECSHCHKIFLDDMCQNNGSDYVDAKKDFEYCPFCGAKMDEVEHE